MTLPQAKAREVGQPCNTDISLDLNPKKVDDPNTDRTMWVAAVAVRNRVIIYET